MYTTQPVPANLVPAIWPSILPLIEKGVEASRGDRIAEDYFAVCADGRAQLWLIGRERTVIGILIAEVVVYPRRRVALGDLLAGEDMAGWLPLMDVELDRWATAMGCSAVQAGGRKGFEKSLNKLGFKTVGVVVEKELAHV
jgi:hypothetical protein